MYEYNVPEKDHIIITRDQQDYLVLLLDYLEILLRKLTQILQTTSSRMSYKQSSFSARFFDSYWNRSYKRILTLI